MSDFRDSHWANEEVSKDYSDNADLFIPERARMLGVAKSFYKNFIGTGKENRVLDIGCGDGILTRELMKIDGSLSATLVDGSAEMIGRARESLRFHEKAEFVVSGFDRLMEGKIELGMFDFAVSSLAIHHLDGTEKVALFRYIHSVLKDNGHFLNMDVVLAPCEPVESWYMELWRQWIIEKKASTGADKEYAGIPEMYKDKSSGNRPDTLKYQLDALAAIGFRDVDCYYKYGIFSIYGGRK